MNRKDFLTLLTGVVAAVLAGIKGAPRSASASVVPDLPVPDFQSSFDAIEVCGIPVYCDPYLPKNMIMLMRTKDPFPYPKEGGPSRYLSEYFATHLDKPTAMQLIVGVTRERGVAPEFVVVNPPSWAQLSDDILKRGNGQRSITWQS